MRHKKSDAADERAGLIDESSNQTEETEKNDSNTMSASADENIEKVIPLKKKNPSKKKTVENSINPALRSQKDGRVCDALDVNESSPGPLLIIRLMAAFTLLLLPRFVDVSYYGVLAMYISSAVISGYDILIAAVHDFSDRIYLRENYLLIIAAVCFFAIGRGFEAAASVLLLRTAYILRAVLIRGIKRSQFSSISLPTLSKGISVGDSIMINEGSRIPTDCTVIDGRAMVDCSFITGDVFPLQFKPGDFIPAGCLCLRGQMMLKAETMPEAAVAARISRVIGSGYKSISDTEKSILSISRYVPVFILLLGLVLLIVLPYSFDLSFIESLQRTATILALASPCAALLSIPMTYLSALISARRAGTVFRDADLMDKTRTIGAVLFDKVGTITNEAYKVSDISTDKLDTATFLKVAAHVAAVSELPMGKAIVEAYGDYIDFDIIRDYVEFRGRGISVKIDDIDVLLGSHAFLTENGVTHSQESYDSTVLMSIQGEYAGRIVLKDTVNADFPNTVRELSAAGVERIVMLSSDSRERDATVAREVGINEYYAECSADEKTRRIKDIRTRMPKNSTLAYVNSGDCEQACRAADIALTIRGMEHNFSLDDSDIVVMGRSVKAVPDAIYRAKSVRKIIFIKLFLSLSVKVVLIALASGGYLSLFIAILLDNLTALALIFDYSAFVGPKKREAE